MLFLCHIIRQMRTTLTTAGTSCKWQRKKCDIHVHRYFFFFFTFRYYAICHPLKARYIRTPKRAGIVICIIWTFSLIVSIPMLIVQRLENRLKVENEHISIAFVCAEYYSEHIYDILHTSFMFVVFYAVPMVVMLFHMEG